MSTFKIYSIEDDDDHFELIDYKIQKISNVELSNRSIDGEEALGIIKEIAKNTVIRPDLILLDINIPKINGLEVLRQIKSYKELSSIPVVAFTTSNSKRDKELAYENHINSYLVKPADFNEMGTVLEEVIHYWKKRNCV